MCTSRSITTMQIVAIEIVIHLHNDDSVAAADVLNTAFGYASRYCNVITGMKGKERPALRLNSN